jgi:hypothetical protein
MIVGLCGLARSGKDTAAAHLVAELGYRRIAFADQMRVALERLDPFVQVGATHMRLTTVLGLRGWDQAKEAPDVRRLLQRFGTEVGREMMGEDVWVDMALRGVVAGDRVVVTDVRFPNEAAAVRRLGGLVVEVQRPGAGLDGIVATHASEAMAFDRDRVLVNDSTVADLHAAIEALVD